jgi:hypothetical protein
MKSLTPQIITSAFLAVFAVSCGDKEGKHKKESNKKTPVEEDVENTEKGEDKKSVEDTESKKPTSVPMPTKNEDIKQDLVVATCQGIQQIVAHVSKVAVSNLSATDVFRYCIHTVENGAEDIVGQPLTGTAISDGTKIAFADVDRTDRGVDYKTAMKICEALVIDGGGWKLPSRASGDQQNTASIDSLMAYLKHSNKWAVTTRFWASDSSLEDGIALVGVPKSGGVVDVYDVTKDGLMCIKQ